MKTITITIPIPENINGLMWVSEAFTELVKTEALKVIEAQKEAETKKLRQQIMQVDKTVIKPFPIRTGL